MTGQKPFSEMSDEEIMVQLRRIRDSAQSEGEVRRMIKDELRCPHQPAIQFIAPGTVMIVINRPPRHSIKI